MCSRYPKKMTEQGHSKEQLFLLRSLLRSPEATKGHIFSKYDVTSMTLHLSVYVPLSEL